MGGIPQDNYRTFSDAYGKQQSHWNGVDVNVNARPRDDLLVAGGFSTGRAFTDNCDVVTKLDNPSAVLSCHPSASSAQQLPDAGQGVRGVHASED